MGTFHSDKGDLHGMTVVVETRGPRVYVGRYDEQRPEGLLLHDVDLHDDGEDGRTRAEYLAFAARYGVFKKHDRVLVPVEEIVSVQRLGELTDT
jgi:hypothetical protein